MKKLILVAILLMVATSFVLAQTSLMLNTKHDLRPTSTKSDSIKNQIAGASDKLCSYCHTPHVPQAGIATPLWARKVKATQGWGNYDSPTMDATTFDPSVITGDQNKNMTNMCLSCHDGSAMYTSAAYEKRPHASSNPSWTGYTTKTVFDAQRLIGGTKYSSLTHTHPVNFTYADAVSADAGIKTAANAAYVYLDGTTQVGRLFDGKVQCSSCHNPHKTDTKMIQGDTADGKLCVACHNK